MKIGRKIMALVVATSLLAPTQVWAATSKQESHKLAKERWIQEQLLIQQHNWGNHKPTIQQADKLSKKSKSVKQKSVPVKKLPKEMESALDGVYKKFPELKELKLKSANIQLETDDRPEMWKFSFENAKKDQKPVQQASVTLLGENKTIVEYTYNDYNDNEPGKQPSEKVAKEKATKFIELVLGKQASKYSFESVEIDDDDDDDDNEDEASTYSAGYDYGPSQANVFFTRVINAIPFDTIGVRIYVNGQGEVTHYYCNYRALLIDEAKFPDPKKAIQGEKVINTYQKLLGMHLLYMKDKLVYKPAYEGEMNAVTGKKIEGIGKVLPKSSFVSLKPGGKVLTASSRTEAESLLKNEFQLDVTGFEFEQWPEDDSDEYLYVNYNWYSNDEDDEVFLSVNKKTHQVVSFSHNQYPIKNNEKIISEKEAKEQAIQLLQPFVKQKVHLAQLTMIEAPSEKADLPDWVESDKLPSYWNDDDYSFRLNELHQNVPVNDRDYYVSINPLTGKLIRMSIADDDVTYSLPDNKGTISAKDAAKAYSDHYGFVLYYTWPEFYGQKAPNPILAYYVLSKKYGYIDAFTGKLEQFKNNK